MLVAFVVNLNLDQNVTNFLPVKFGLKFAFYLQVDMKDCVDIIRTREIDGKQLLVSTKLNRIHRLSNGRRRRRHLDTSLPFFSFGYRL
jgi:hypothetical protein